MLLMLLLYHAQSSLKSNLSFQLGCSDQLLQLGHSASKAICLLLLHKLHLRKLSF